MLPSWQLLEKVSRKIMSIPNRRKETKRGIHYGLFLLGYKSGLRVNEAARFDLSNKTQQGLYKISKCKGKKERLVYIPKKVIRELKKSNWKPHQTNRFAFYHFLRKIKRELNIKQEIELSPHTLRRSFATYHAENKVPLPLLQKLLGHSSIRTTALYWQNIYGEDEIGDILAGKKWLERPKKPPLSEYNSVPPTERNFSQPPENLEPKKPSFSQANRSKTNIPKLFIKPNPLPPIEIRKKLVNQSISEISLKSPELTLENFPPLIIKKEVKKPEISEPLPVISEKEPTQEQILLKKIKGLQEQLKEVQVENDRLRIDKEQAEQLFQDEKQRADNYEQQLKIIAKGIYQWSKINHYKKLEQEQKAQIAQPTKPLNFKK